MKDIHQMEVLIIYLFFFCGPKEDTVSVFVKTAIIEGKKKNINRTGVSELFNQSVYLCVSLWKAVSHASSHHDFLPLLLLSTFLFLPLLPSSLPSSVWLLNI